MIFDGSITVNGNCAPKNYVVKHGDIVNVILPESKALEVIPENIPLDILYEDDDLLVVNKPKGMVVHPAPGHIDGTLVNALLWHCSDSLSGINGIKRPGIVHRIDKDTSGLLVVAKNDAAHLSLTSQFAEHSMERQYQAVCHGVFKEDSGTIDRPIGRDGKDRKKFSCNAKNGKHAVTHYELIQNFDRFSHLSLNLETGRTHQIRVHLASIGHPVAGDVLYGPKSTPRELEGQCLHAKTLGFVHPSTGEFMRFESDLPDYFVSYLNKLSGKGNA